jgi:UDPglucose 6-dehydrogenase
MENFRRRFPQVRYADAAADVLDSDAVLIITEWPEFGELDYSGRTVIDGRGVGQARSTARIYEGVCW